MADDILKADWDHLRHELRAHWRALAEADVK